MKMRSCLLILSVALLATTGCTKECEEDGDSQMPMIKMSSPANNQVFSVGQTVNIGATITDNKKIQRIHLEIINTNTGVFIAHEHYTPGTAEYKLEKTFTTQPAATYKIKVQAEDVGGNIAKVETGITSN